MINSTQISYFTLAAYFDTGVFKYLLFTLILSLYVFIVCANLLLIVVICMNRSLHEPMYILMCSLFVNGLYGSTWLFPFLMIQIFLDSHIVSASVCFLQIFCVYSYGAVEYLNLAFMSYDRYLAICDPLHYNTRMTYNKVAMFIFLTWFYPCLGVLVLLSLALPLQLCGNIIYKVYCDIHSVTKLACFSTSLINIYGLMITFSTIVGCLLSIMYTYMRILQVCLSGSEQTRQKAVSTCTPHLAALLNFSVGACFEIIQSRYNMSGVPNMLRIFLSLYFLTCPPLFNPVMYGLKMSKIRNICKSLISKVDTSN
ncbi:olfactory receptor 4D1-like [Mastacembelus armatus]|uniref:olfactory receptor 4D1-like n=1 Tax=Mastacembelus armatus TaxID=205130 RepID=UPI000E45A0FB|nr:olfactory receptor 4D1-like [Mastacembelus armatus]